MEPTILTPKDLKHYADTAYLDAIIVARNAALLYVPAINDLLEAAAKKSMTHVENTIVIPGEILEKICESETRYMETPGGTESMTKYDLIKLNMVGEALFALIKDAGYTTNVFPHNELTVYAK